MTKAGNYAFMLILSFGAVMAVTGIVLLGFTTVSLATLIMSVVGSLLLGVYVENVINNRYYKKVDAEAQADIAMVDKELENLEVEIDFSDPIVLSDTPMTRQIRYGDKIFEIKDEKKLIYMLIQHAYVSDLGEYLELEEVELGAVIASYRKPEELPVVEKLPPASPGVFGLTSDVYER